MPSPIRRRTAIAPLLALAVLGAAALASQGAPLAQRTAAAQADGMPHYDAEGNLRLPDGYRQWVLVGSSLGLSYAEGAQGRQMFHATLMEPSAYRHFAETGEFREGTMLALVLQGVGTDAAPARQGQYATAVRAVEMAVKDAARLPEGWAYYDFGGPLAGGYRATAAPQPKNRCFDCHAEHAARDKVFTQFYGLLDEAAGAR